MTRTFANMTPEQREACVGRWCEIALGSLGKVIRHELGVIGRIQWNAEFGAVEVINPENMSIWSGCRFHTITPRFDLPRAWSADGMPVKGKWETAADYDGLGNGFYLDTESPTHHRFISRWEAINETN